MSDIEDQGLRPTQQMEPISATPEITELTDQWKRIEPGDHIAVELQQKNTLQILPGKPGESPVLEISFDEEDTPQLSYEDPITEEKIVIKLNTEGRAMTIGRSDKNDIKISKVYKSTSRQHAKLHYNPKSKLLTIDDISTFGTGVRRESTEKE